jgi:murein DD-endopeptidase MepM/ murein hydrolase activator NlpD
MPKKLLSLIVLISLNIVYIFPLGMVFADYQTDKQVKQINNEMANVNNKIEEIEEEIKRLNSQIAETNEEKKTLSNAINQLNLTRNQLLKQKELIQNKIKATEYTISDISSKIGEKEEVIKISKNSLAKLIRILNQNDNVSVVEKLLTVDNISEVSRHYNDILSVNEKIKDNINLLSDEKYKLKIDKIKKEDEQENLNNLKNNLIQKEKAVNVTKKEKDDLLKETKNQEAEYQKMLAEQLKLKDAFEKELQEYESQLKFILNPKTIPKAANGVLSWPLENILITSVFGSRWGTTHYGTDFRASIGTPVKSVYSGTIEGIGDTDKDCPKASFGKWVFIKHTNGLSSTYGHLSVISVKVGQKVKAGDIIGLSGNTGYSTGPHLHLSVYASDGVSVETKPSVTCKGKIFTQPIAATDAHLDPLLYLPKTIPGMFKN